MSLKVEDNTRTTFKGVRIMQEERSKKSGVFQLEDGNWGYRFIVTVNGKRKAQKRIMDEFGKPFKTEAQAAKARAKNIEIAKALVKESQKEEESPKKTVERKTVEEIFNEYCQRGRSGKAYSTKKKQDSLWRNYLLDRFGDRYVDEISVAEVNDYLAELYSDYGLAYGYVEGFLKQFYLIFGQAYSRDYLDVNIYNKLCVNKNTKIHMPTMKSTDVKEIEAYTSKELALMDSYFKGKNVETAYMIGRYCGVRVAECYGILWEDINFEEGYISINKQFHMQDGLAKLTPLKTKNAKRKVFMNSELIEFLLKRKREFQEHEIKLAAQRRQNEIMIENTDGEMISSLLLVNTLPNGRYQTEWAIKHHMRPIKQKYGIHFKFHNLRHTYGTSLAMMNTPEHILLNQMGHSKSSTTHKYYLAISDEGISELKKNLEKI